MDMQNIPGAHEQAIYDGWSDEEMYIEEDMIEHQDMNDQCMADCFEIEEQDHNDVCDSYEQLRADRERHIQCMIQENKEVMCVAGSSDDHAKAAKAIKELEKYQFEDDPLAENLMKNLGTKMDITPYIAAPTHTPPRSPSELGEQYYNDSDLDMSEVDEHVLSAGSHHEGHGNARSRNSGPHFEDYNHEQSSQGFNSTFDGPACESNSSLVPVSDGTDVGSTCPDLESLKDTKTSPSSHDQFESDHNGTKPSAPNGAGSAGRTP